MLQEVACEAERLRQLRDDFWKRLSTGIADICLNGHPAERLPNNLNICIKELEAEGLLLLLNAKGVEASMGSACDSESFEPSHVIQALGLSPEWERGALRLTLGKQTTQEEINYAADTIIEIVNELQN